MDLIFFSLQAVFGRTSRSRLGNILYVFAADPTKGHGQSIEESTIASMCRWNKARKMCLEEVKLDVLIKPNTYDGQKEIPRAKAKKGSPKLVRSL